MFKCGLAMAVFSPGTRSFAAPSSELHVLQLAESVEMPDACQISIEQF